MPYHSLGRYSDGYMEEPVMAELAVHREPSEYQEPFHHSYPPASNRYQEQINQPSFMEHLHHQAVPQHQHMMPQQEPNIQPHDPPQGVTPVKKKRGRPAKKQAEDKDIKEEVDEAEAAKKAKRVLNRFNGMSVAEVMTKTLPDVLTYNLDILIVRKCLFLSGLTEQQLNYMHDQSLPGKYSIGFTNMVERTTPGSKDLSR
ncbi:hypothetical protein XENOCAPTIV_015228 [Xenoophorus captivus]|uniref:Uncharacterized protein n=1 Tax=Xenoophorus captivus TaxID=1517983 RepID=A0ABV0R1M4_9TELE